MRADMLLDAMGKIDDAYLVSAAEKIVGVSGRDRHVRYRGARRGLAAAAAIVILLISSFSVTMAVNADFRNAVLRFFHLPATDRVLPKESEPAPRESEVISNIGSVGIGDAAEVEYIRIYGRYTYSNGVVWKFSDEEDENGNPTGEIQGAYMVEGGELLPLEPHEEAFTYMWDGEPYEVAFVWYENAGAVHIYAHNYDLDTGREWRVSACRGNSDFAAVELWRGSQIEYTMRPLLYNLRTGEVLDVLEGCEALDGQYIVETEFSPNLSKALITCYDSGIGDYGGTVEYCYDIAERALYPLNELSGVEVSGASFIDEDTLNCISEEEDGTLTCRAVSIFSGDSRLIYSGLPGENRDTNTGVLLTQGRYGLFIDEQHNIYVYDCKTGERAVVEGFKAPAGKIFATSNSAGTRILFSLFDSEAEGLAVSQFGIMDLERQTFILIDREGYETRRESVVGWFDDERVAISATADSSTIETYQYLYIYTVNTVPVQE